MEQFEVICVNTDTIEKDGIFCTPHLLKKGKIYIVVGKAFIGPKNFPAYKVNDKSGNIVGCALIERFIKLENIDDLINNIITEPCVEKLKREIPLLSPERV